MMKDAIIGILSLGLIGSILTYIANSLGFFYLTSFKRPSVELSHLTALFAIYLSFLFLSPPLVSFILSTLSSYPEISYQTIGTVQFIITMGMLISILLYILSDPSDRFKVVLKNPQGTFFSFTDFGIGCMTWLFAFPWVAMINQLCDALIFPSVETHPYEQTAVTYLKQSLEFPLQAFFALTSVIIIAPFLEEFLFRGILQQYFKKFFSVNSSILLTSFIFAIFHFSTSQHLGNVSLMASLFFLSYFLGYLYERQGSLYAPIGLHMSFNLASTLQIIFFQGA
ncbi:MAG: CPBP family intramembrane metalloprotease [Candidatus Rhabdochlamydia sp.]